MKMEFENVMKSINLSINYIEIDEVELNFDWKNEKMKEKLKQLINDFKNCKDEDKSALYDEVSQ